MEGIKEVEGVGTSISELKETDLDAIHRHGAILIGSPNYMGGPTRGIKAKSNKTCTSLPSVYLLCLKNRTKTKNTSC
ncbi:MAG: hypothetical protein QXH37_04270 [Candidatus Bathyarchaeia archaeon]